MNVVRFDDGDAHAACEALLPWYALGQVDAQERAEIEAHLGACAPCRAALARERQLQRLLGEAMPDAPRERDIARGFAALRDRIDSEQAAAWWTRPSTLPAAWRVLLLAQAVVIGLMVAVLLWPRAPVDARYRTLGAAPAALAVRADAVVSFAPGTSEAQLREALRAVGARLVDGPTASDAWLVALPQGDAGALARLRAQPGVSLAVSLDSGRAP